MDVAVVLVVVHVVKNGSKTLTFIFIGRVSVMLTNAVLASADQSLSPLWSHGTMLSRQQTVDSRGVLVKSDGTG